MQNAIITGGTGFIGVHLIETLLANKIEITALCRKDSPNLARIPAGVRIAYDFSELEPCDVFYHLAWDGASGVGRGDALTQSKNVEFALSAAELAATKLLCGKFIMLGTVYEHFAESVSESNKFSGADFYILSKQYAHSLVKQSAYKLQLPFVHCTICHPIGKHIKQEQMMAYVVSCLISGIPPEFGPGNSIYDIIAVEDVALGLYLLGAGNTGHGDYYIGSGAPRILRDYLIEAGQLIDPDISIAFDKKPDDGLRFDPEWFDISRIKEDVGFVPQVAFADAVVNIARWIKQK